MSFDDYDKSKIRLPWDYIYSFFLESLRYVWQPSTQNFLFMDKR